MPEAVVLIVPGSASSPSFVERAFAPVIGGRPVRPVSHPSGQAEAVSELVANELRARTVAAVVGVSLGAHAAAIAAAATGWSGGALVLAMPAWTGPAGPVAAATAAAADQIEQRGLTAELSRLQRDYGDDWVTQELVAAWSGMAQDRLVAALRGTSTSRGPDLGELSAVAARSAVVALADDPLHPTEVADAWAAAIPQAVVATIARQAPAADREVFGRAALAALGAPHPFTGLR